MKKKNALVCSVFVLVLVLLLAVLYLVFRNTGNKTKEKKKQEEQVQSLNRLRNKREVTDPFPYNDITNKPVIQNHQGHHNLGLAPDRISLANFVNSLQDLRDGITCNGNSCKVNTDNFSVGNAYHFTPERMWYQDQTNDTSSWDIDNRQSVLSIRRVDLIPKFVSNLEVVGNNTVVINNNLRLRIRWKYASNLTRIGLYSQMQVGSPEPLSSSSTTDPVPILDQEIVSVNELKTGEKTFYVQKSEPGSHDFFCVLEAIPDTDTGGDDVSREESNVVKLKWEPMPPAYITRVLVNSVGGTRKHITAYFNWGPQERRAHKLEFYDSTTSQSPRLTTLTQGLASAWLFYYETYGVSRNRVFKLYDADGNILHIRQSYV